VIDKCMPALKKMLISTESRDLYYYY